VLHCYLNKEKTTIRGTGGYQKGMHKKTEGQDKVAYVELLHSIGRKDQEQVVYTISEKEKSKT
jgi:hypothetical protein